MPKLPPLNGVRMFEAASRHLNFRLAAEELNVTQGAVAQQVRQLEAVLGILLFRRLPRGLALTEAGERYARQISAALILISEATEALQPTCDTLTVSVTPSFATKWLIPHLSGFTDNHPGIDVRIEAVEKIADFRTDNVDLAVRMGRPPFGEDLEWTLLLPVDLSAYASPEIAKSAPDIHATEKEWADWLSDQVLIHDGHRYWQSHWKRLNAVQLSSGQSLKFNQTAMASDAAAQGQGVVLAPRWLVEQDVRAGRLVHLFSSDAESGSSLFLVQPKKNAGAGKIAVQLFVDWLLEETSTTKQL